MIRQFPTPLFLNARKILAGSPLSLVPKLEVSYIFTVPMELHMGRWISSDTNTSGLIFCARRKGKAGYSGRSDFLTFAWNRRVVGKQTEDSKAMVKLIKTFEARPNRQQATNNP